VLLYWAALTLGPILVVGGIAATSYVTAMPLLHGAATQINSIGHRLLGVLPFVVTFLTLWLMYTFIPNIRVSRRDSAIGALLGAVLFEIVRWGFIVYIRHAQTYQQIYGALAAIPILLLWIYLSWVIVILAASIAASAAAFDYNAPKEMLPEGAEFLGLLKVLQRFVETHRDGRGVDQAQVQAQEPYLRNVLIEDYFDELCKADLIRVDENGFWMLCRSLDSTDLLRVYQSSQYHLPLEPVALSQKLGIGLSPALLALLAELAESVRARLHTRLDQAYPLAADATEDRTEV
jgi:membrane protein